MDASVVWPQKGFLFIPLENSCIMSVTANGLSCFAFSETNDELVAPFFHIRYAPFYFYFYFLKTYAPRFSFYEC